MVIVTQNQYILASKIHHIVLNEGYEYHDVRNSGGRLIGVRENTYSIYVLYTPEITQNGQHNSRGEEQRECTVTMRGKVHAYQVYKDLIRQIREQMPDALFLDKALENLLNDADFAKIAESEIEDNKKCEEKMSVKAVNARARKVRAARKAKRASKKVLRKPKRSNRGRR